MQSVIHRNLLVDDLRGIALLLMAIFHFSYNLSLYGYLDFTMDGGFFTWFRFVIVTLFFTGVGFGLYAAHHKAIQWRSFWQRLIKISASAALLSAVTYVVYPNSWIWFGVLHFIALATLLSIPLISHPKLALVLGISVFLLFNTTDWFNLSPLWIWLREPLNLPPGTMDLTRLVPWIGMVWIGIFLGSVNFFNLPSIPFPTLNRPLRWLSRNSLVFYLVHQLPLYGLAWLIAYSHQLLISS